MATIRSFGSIIPDVTIEETGEDTLEITQHPVQQGAAITDHAYKKPVTLKMTMGFSDVSGDINETYKKLLALQEKREPIDVMTGKRSYKNMMIKSLSQTTDANTNAVLIISADLVEIIIVPVTVTNVPPRARQKNAGKTGSTDKSGTKSASEVPATEVRKKSALRSFFG